MGRALGAAHDIPMDGDIVMVAGKRSLTRLQGTVSEAVEDLCGIKGFKPR